MQFLFVVVCSSRVKNNGDLTSMAPPLTPKDKRILITKIIADVHEEMTSSKRFYCGFIATGTWMPVYNLMEGSGDGPSSIPKDAQAQLQHMPKYKYTEKFCREKMLVAIDQLKKEEARIEAEMMEIQKEEERIQKEFEETLMKFECKALEKG